MGSESSPSDTDKRTSSVTTGDVEGGIHDSVVVGRDFVIQIVQQTGGQIPQARNLPAQLAALQQALPHLTHPAEKAATQAAIERLEEAIAALQAHEDTYRERIKAQYAEDAPYYVPLAAETTEATSLPAEAKAPRTARRRKQRAMAEYCEWIQTEPVDRSSVRFYHQLLQEYFAAHHMLKPDPDNLAELWRWPWLEVDMPPWVRPEDNYDPLPPPPPRAGRRRPSWRQAWRRRMMTNWCEP